MTNPITPPPELVQQWMSEFYGTIITPGEATTDIATRAAQWGADQELEACCALMDDWGLEASDLRAARRPKPLSLKEEALGGLDQLAVRLTEAGVAVDLDTIRRALEALPKPVAPTDEELLMLMPEAMRDEFSYAAKTCSDAMGGAVKPGIFRVALNTAALEYARAVLARCGTANNTINQEGFDA